MVLGPSQLCGLCTLQHIQLQKPHLTVIRKVWTIVIFLCRSFQMSCHLIHLYVIIKSQECFKSKYNVKINLSNEKEVGKPQPYGLTLGKFSGVRINIYFTTTCRIIRNIHKEDHFSIIKITKRKLNLINNSRA